MSGGSARWVGMMVGMLEDLRLPRSSRWGGSGCGETRWRGAWSGGRIRGVDCAERGVGDRQAGRRRVCRAAAVSLNECVGSRGAPMTVFSSVSSPRTPPPPPPNASPPPPHVLSYFTPTVNSSASSARPTRPPPQAPPLSCPSVQCGEVWCRQTAAGTSVDCPVEMFWGGWGGRGQFVSLLQRSFEHCFNHLCCSDLAVRVVLVIDRHGQSLGSSYEREQHVRAFVGAQLLVFLLRCLKNAYSVTASFHARPSII